MDNYEHPPRASNYIRAIHRVGIIAEVGYEVECQERDGNCTVAHLNEREALICEAAKLCLRVQEIDIKMGVIA